MENQRYYAAFFKLDGKTHYKIHFDPKVVHMAKNSSLEEAIKDISTHIPETCSDGEAEARIMNEDTTNFSFKGDYSSLTPEELELVRAELQKAKPNWQFYV